MDTKTHICNEKHSWALDNTIRRLVQPPGTLIDRFISPGMTILDLGCGPGYFTLPMAHKTGSKGSVTAADIQAGMLVRIKNKIKNTALENRIIIHNCGEKSIGLLGQYDFALTFWMVHEVPNANNFIGEIFKLMKNGGKWLFVEPKGHVNKYEFNKNVVLAKQIGFTIEDEPKIGFSRAVLFIKNTNEQ